MHIRVCRRWDRAALRGGDARRDGGRAHGGPRLPLLPRRQRLWLSQQRGVRSVRGASCCFSKCTDLHGRVRVWGLPERACVRGVHGGLHHADRHGPFGGRVRPLRSRHLREPPHGRRMRGVRGRHNVTSRGPQLRGGVSHVGRRDGLCVHGLCLRAHDPQLRRADPDGARWGRQCTGLQHPTVTPLPPPFSPTFAYGAPRLGFAQ